MTAVFFASGGCTSGGYRCGWLARSGVSPAVQARSVQPVPAMPEACCSVQAYGRDRGIFVLRNSRQ
ncbi:hypothetical protein ACHHV8_06970 [Paenibacillus sp. TAB 01]|uniref:hypothetical protein n=1 Tax=Paenibacillus sp. TAB 01 TaxID=3368988 RepID=UPI003751C33A